MTRRSFSLLAMTAVVGLCGATAAQEQTGRRQSAEKQPPILGEVEYRPAGDESSVPKHFRLEAHRFSFRQQPLGQITDEMAISLVTFPSPVKTPHANNNTVHCEYYQPLRNGKPIEGGAPGVVVLHILGGDFALSRLICNVLANRGVAALFVKMPYYGPRRQPGVPRRMISRDPRETVAGMTQAVLDIRRSVAWLASREEVDSKRLGICGISLGGITGALATTAEPRLANSCLLLAGGDIGRLAWDSPELAGLRKWWTDQGKTREDYLQLVTKVDPVTYAANARSRRILMLNADSDEVVPKACTVSLWQALGKPEIVWYSGGHYTVARHVLNMLYRTGEFFAAEASP